MKAEAYRLMAMAAKRDYARRRRDERVPPTHLYTCRHCGMGVAADQAAAHVARCPAKKP